MKVQARLTMLILFLMSTLLGCILAPSVNRTYWFSDPADVSGVIHDIESRYENDYLYQFLRINPDDFSDKVIHSNYAVGGVFKNINRIDYTGSPMAVYYLYELEESPVKAIGLCFNVVGRDEVTEEFSYIEYTGVDLMHYVDTVSKTDVLDFTKDLIDHSSDYQIIYYNIVSTVGELTVNYGRISFYYENDTLRDESYETEMMGHILEMIHFRIQTSPATPLTT